VILAEMERRATFRRHTHLFFDNFIILNTSADSYVVFASINIDRLAFARNEPFVRIPKDLIFAMSAFVVCFLLRFCGDLFYHFGKSLFLK